MADYRTLYDSAYIYAYDLAKDGKPVDVTVTIREVRAVKVQNADKKPQKKPIVFFKESKDDRGLVLCKTNGKVIAGMFGNRTEDWIGKRITLYSTMVDAFGQTVEAIRIRPKPPTVAAKPGEFAAVEERPTPESPEHAELNEAGV